MPKAFASLMGQDLMTDYSPEIMLFAIYLHEDFIGEEGITISLVLS